MYQMVDRFFAEKDRQLLCAQRFSAAACRVQVHDEEISPMPKSGRLQGYPCAAMEVGIIYSGPLHRFQKRLHAKDAVGKAVVTPDFVRGAQDMSLTAYADDDIAKETLLTKGPDLLVPLIQERWIVKKVDSILALDKTSLVLPQQNFSTSNPYTATADVYCHYKSLVVMSFARYLS
eukprot:TRINITY_DN48190_c0_g1_i1.p2 TRINITY_DN48190_c0_g1~~TRINITY_DN48190_c0_g1_i1.p2  ORF type:complete len:176 (+),score=40.22 TRINITY_DN48190_c0_g1_i1:2342-2869(+)